MIVDFGAVERSKEAQEKGAKLELVDPVTGEPLGMSMTIAGPDSDIQAQARRAMAARLRSTKGGITEKSRDNLAVEFLASIILDWSVTVDGEPLRFDHENAVRVLSTGTWIRAQVDEFAADRRPYGLSNYRVVNS